MNFGEKLREIRESKPMSQKALGEASGEAQQSIARWEAGTHFPDVRALRNLCQALGVRCAVFEDCDFGVNQEKRGRGRPAKVPAEPATKAKRKKGGVK